MTGRAKRRASRLSIARQCSCSPFSFPDAPLIQRSRAHSFVTFAWSPLAVSLSNARIVVRCRLLSSDIRRRFHVVLAAGANPGSWFSEMRHVQKYLSVPLVASPRLPETLPKGLTLRPVLRPRCGVDCGCHPRLIASSANSLGVSQQIQHLLRPRVLDLILFGRCANAEQLLRDKRH